MALFLQPAPYTPEVEPVGVDTPPFDPNGNIAAAAAEEAAAKEAERRQKLKDDEHLRLDLYAEVQREREEVTLSEGLPESAKVAYDKLTIGMRNRDQYVKLEHPKPLVQGLLNMDSLSWIAGPSGSLKSFVAADLAFRYASEDMSYHNRKMTHGRVLFVVAEGGAAFQGRILAWEKEHGREVQNVQFYPQPIQLADIERDVAALVHHMAIERDAGHPYGLVIFDTQSLCTSGVDENSNDMTRVINVLHRLRRVNGACIMPIHHTGKDGSKGLRGSSTIHAAADTVIMSMRAKAKKADDSEDDGDDAPAPLTVTLSTSQENKGKQKDLIEEDKALTFDFEVHEVGTDWFGDPITSLVPLTHAARLADRDGGEDKLPEVTPKRQPVLLALKSNERISVSTSVAGDRAGTKRQYTLEILTALEKDGLVRYTKSGATYHWNVTRLGLRKIEQLEQQALIWTPTSTQTHDPEVLSGTLSDSPGDSTFGQSRQSPDSSTDSTPDLH